MGLKQTTSIFTSPSGGFDHPSHSSKSPRVGSIDEIFNEIPAGSELDGESALRFYMSVTTVTICFYASWDPRTLPPPSS